MRPLKQSKIEFYNACGCIVDLDLLERAMLWYSDDTLKTPKTIYMHGMYPAVSIYDKKIHVHRLIAMYSGREILARSLHVHHKDGNKMNCSEDNLEVICGKKHISHHLKGRTLSDEHKRKIAEANKLRKGVKMKRKYNFKVSEVRSMLRLGMSINQISKRYGCDWSTVKRFINENPELL